MELATETAPRRWRAYWLERLAFIYKNALACLFPVGIFALLAVSRLFETPIPRYDFLLLGCLALQYLMVASGLESWDEVKVILVFHVLGLGLELFKTQMGSWSYPEASYLKVGGVPLYSGFMYASVASFMCQAWRRFDMGLENWPARLLVTPLGAAIYLNFFSHHYLPDLRYVLVAAVLALFWRTRVTFVPYRRRFALPLPWAFAFIGLFVWLAENISTRLGAWVYPEQVLAWRLVSPSKIVAWGLLVIVSFMIVAQLKRFKAERSSGAGE